MTKEAKHKRSSGEVVTIPCHIPDGYRRTAIEPGTGITIFPDGRVIWHGRS